MTRNLSNIYEEVSFSYMNIRRGFQTKPLTEFEEKQEPTTSVQMKVEFRKMGKTNLLMIIMIVVMTRLS